MAGKGTSLLGTEKQTFGDRDTPCTHSRVDVLIPPRALDGEYQQASSLLLLLTPVGQTMVGNKSASSPKGRMLCRPLAAFGVYVDRERR